MKKPTKELRSHCPINYGLEAFGDRWALLILRDIVFRGKRTYGEFLRSEEGFATNVLASRLEHLLAAGILRRDPDETDRRRDIYSLTEKGLDLIPVILEINDSAVVERVRPLYLRRLPCWAMAGIPCSWGLKIMRKVERRWNGSARTTAASATR